MNIKIRLSRNIIIIFSCGFLLLLVLWAGYKIVIQGKNVVLFESEKSLQLSVHYLAPGKAKIRFTPAENPDGGGMYNIKIHEKNLVRISTQWVRGNEITLVQEPDQYYVDVAPTGARHQRILVDLTDINDRHAFPLHPLAPVRGPGVAFSWLPVNHAIAYGLTVRYPDGTSKEYEAIQPSRVISLTPGEYEWQVTPRYQEALVKAEQPWFRFSVTDGALSREMVIGFPPDVDVQGKFVKLNVPEDAVQAEDGTIYISDTQSHVIRRRRTDGMTDVWAGDFRKGYNGDGPGRQTLFHQPTALALDRKGGLIVADSKNYLIRRIDLATSMVTTIAGRPGVKEFPKPGKPGKGSPIQYNTVLKYDDRGNLYIPMSVPAGPGVYESRLFYITQEGILGERPLPDFIRTRTINDLGFQKGNIDFLHDKGWFSRLSSNGSLKTIQLPNKHVGGLAYMPDGSPVIGNYSGIYRLGLGLEVLVEALANVTAIHRVPDGFLVVDGDRGSILKMTLDWKRVRNFVLGAGGSNRLGSIARIARYDEDTLLFLDNTVPRVLAYSLTSGELSVFAGNGLIGKAKMGVDKLRTPLNYPRGIAVDQNKNVFIAEKYKIFMISPTGITNSIAGISKSGDQLGKDLEENLFNSIYNIQMDQEGNLLVADTYNNKIKRITLKDSTPQKVELVAGGGKTYPYTPKDVGEVRLHRPLFAAQAADGQIYIANSWTHALMRLDNQGKIHHVAGRPRITYQGGGSFSGDGGPAIDAQLNTPGTILMHNGELIFTDVFNFRIRKIDRQGMISTIFGKGMGWAQDGSRLNYANDIHIAGEYLYIADSGNGVVSRVPLASLGLDD